jgi:hypothetical protein
MTPETLRAWWFHRQGLDGACAGLPPAEVLARTGWARSVGGSAPYLGLHARCGAGRAAIDQAVADLAIHELPSARGCTYVVPAADFALALRLSQDFGPEAEMKVARKLGVTDAEVDRLAAAVLAALAAGPLDPEQLRAATGGAARSLGEAGKKKGLSTTLPLALGRLQSVGEIRRVPVNGRLDQQRYRYTLWRPNPLAGSRMSAAEAAVELARRYFAWIGPASLAEWQEFAGLGARAARAAAEPLDLVSLAPGTGGGDRLLSADQRAALAAFAPPAAPRYALVSSLDGMLLLRHDLPGLLNAADRERQVPVTRGAAALGGLTHLPSHAILDRGRLAGLWEYDPQAEEIVWISFGRAGEALRAAVAATAEFVRGDLGDARSFSLDSPQSRVPRLQALRAIRDQDPG